jgi:hypothetical protein
VAKDIPVANTMAAAGPQIEATVNFSCLCILALHVSAYLLSLLFVPNTPTIEMLQNNKRKAVRF